MSGRAAMAALVRQSRSGTNRATASARWTIGRNLARHLRGGVAGEFPLPSLCITALLLRLRFSLMDLIRRVTSNTGGFLLFALTPPRLATPVDRVQEIADATVARLQPLNLDGLILYDIDDEAARNPTQRPFPFTPTLDPAHYLANNLTNWTTPVIVYRVAGKYGLWDLQSWLAAQDPSRVMTVLVGAAASDPGIRTSLANAQASSRNVNPALASAASRYPNATAVATTNTFGYWRSRTRAAVSS